MNGYKDEKQASTALGNFATGTDYTALLKVRVMSLVVFTAFTGLILAPGHMNPILAFIAILAIAIGGGAAGALNMWYDADIDAIMKRTQSRAIPQGFIRKDQALAFGLFLAVFSVVTMGVFLNWFAALFLAFTIFFYVVIYTMWLKRRTPQNIVIGGASGAFPPMIGWAAVTGHIAIESVILFLIIFLWTPPHFWALSLFSSNDYGNAGVPMLPNVAGKAVTQKYCFFYAILMAIAGTMPYFVGFAGAVYGLVSVIFGVLFVYRAFILWHMKEDSAIILQAKKLFFLSLYYLSGLFSVLLSEHLIYRLLTILY